ncbi:MAG: hypothetical protein AB7V56_08600 [Candidatus Nitrosocosmicus sp.]
MGYRIPPSIKSKVLMMWLTGTPRNEIAHRVDIGYGSVSRILDKIKSEVPDLDLLREVALKIKKEDFNLSEVASGIRLSNFLKQMGSSEEKMEKLLQFMEIYCYKTDQDFHDFIGIVEKIKEFEADFNITIHQIPDFLKQKKQELYKLSSKILEKELSLDEADVESCTW